MAYGKKELIEDISDIKRLAGLNEAPKKAAPASNPDPNNYGYFSKNNDSPYGFARSGSDDDSAANFFASDKRMRDAQAAQAAQAAPAAPKATAPKATAPKATAPKTTPYKSSQPSPVPYPTSPTGPAEPNKSWQPDGPQAADLSPPGSDAPLKNYTLPKDVAGGDTSKAPGFGARLAPSAPPAAPAPTPPAPTPPAATSPSVTGNTDPFNDSPTPQPSTPSPLVTTPKTSGPNPLADLKSKPAPNPFTPTDTGPTSSTAPTVDNLNKLDKGTPGFTGSTTDKVPDTSTFKTQSDLGAGYHYAKTDADNKFGDYSNVDLADKEPNTMKDIVKELRQMADLPEEVEQSMNMDVEGEDEMDQGLPHKDEWEYDREGDMAKDQLHSIVRHAEELEKALSDTENLPEWVQEKMARIKGMMQGVTDYMLTQHERGEEQRTGEEGIHGDDMEEGNQFSGELEKARAAGKKDFTVGGTTYPVKEGIEVNPVTDSLKLIKTLAGLK